MGYIYNIYIVIIYWFVVWNVNFMTFHILGIIISTDFHIFQRDRYTTNQIKMDDLGYPYFRKPPFMAQFFSCTVATKPPQY